MNNSVWEKRRKRLFELIEIGSNYDAWCWGYDFFNTFTILLNLTVSIMYTFDNMEMKYGPLLLSLERLTVAFFAIDFLLRVFTAKYLYPDVSEPRAIGKYLTSFSGIVDMLSFIPYYMPFFFPSGAVAFRMLRIIRIFRLFRINAYYDSLNVITEVIVGKKQQLLSSVFIILILMLSSSLCMYSLENHSRKFLQTHFPESGGPPPLCSQLAMVIFILSPPWARFSEYLSHFLVSVWLPSPPVLFPPDLSISTRA